MAMEYQKRKVLFLITKSNFGGAQRYVYDLATSLPPEQFEAVVALGGDGPLAHKLREAGIRVISIPSLERDISLAKEVRSFFEIWRILKTENPDIFHINSSKAGALGSLVGRISHTSKIIFTSHGWAFNEDRPLWQRVILKSTQWLTVLLSHQTIAVSRELKRQMNWPFAQRKIAVIHNGRSIKELKSRNEARAFLCEHEPRLLPFQDDFWSMTIAELHPVKRHDATIEVFKEVIEREPYTRHLIIGTGEEREALEQKIVALGLIDHVFMMGSINEAAKYLKAADIFLLPSRSEGMPYVLIEALIAGVPVIATSVGGIPEVVDHNLSGILTPPLDNKALFEAVIKVRQNEKLRKQFSEKSLERAVEFSLEKTLNKTIDLYRS